MSVRGGKQEQGKQQSSGEGKAGTGPSGWIGFLEVKG